jgi:PST family polysaccharide transporter
VFRLQILQLIVLSLPILTQMWVARSLGAFEYGRFVFVAALTAALVLLCDFGFGWSASRAIAIHRDDRRRCAEIVCETLLAKCVLFAGCVLLLFVLIGLIEQLRVEAALAIVALGGVLGSAISPTWYFIGTERPHIGYCVDIVGRLAAAITAVIAVRDAGDVMIAVGAVSVGGLISGLLGAALLWRERDLQWARPSSERLLLTLREGMPLFLSTSAAALYTAANGFVLGLITTREEVAYFGAAHRIVSTGMLAFNPFHQIFYPKVARELRHCPSDAKRTLTTALLVQGGLGLVTAVVIFLQAEPLMVLAFGESFRPADVLKLMALIPLVMAVASVFANFVVMALGRDRLHLMMTCGAALLNFVILMTIGESAGAVGGGIAMLAAETFVLVFAVSAGLLLLRRVLRNASSVSRSGALT